MICRYKGKYKEQVRFFGEDSSAPQVQTESCHLRLKRPA